MPEGATPSSDAPASPDGTNGGTTSTATDEFKPITSQADLDALLKPRLDRERAKYADYNDLKAKAGRLDEIEQANKSELEKANDRATQAETEAATVPAKVADALRTHLVALGVVAKDDEVLLTASDPDALIAQVKRLADRDSGRKKNNNVVPKEGSTPSATPSDERAFVRELFAGG